MSRNWSSIVVALAMMTASSAYAQDTSGGATSGTAAPSAASDGTAAAPQDPGVGAEVAPAQGPVVAGGDAGMLTAAGFEIGTTTLLVGAAVVGGVICIAVCGSGHGSSTTTTTTGH
ncbi:MAG TPA: hypothetical protein VGF97_01945 [Rhizomicrobium sp.]|jgi:hypothetical protein